MIKKISIALSCSFVIALLSFLPPDTKKPVQVRGLRTIIVDAGHGGKATGTSGAYSMEKDICLDIAMKLGKKLEEAFPEVKVLYTRTKDVDVDNRWRADFANKSGGDLFVSIHANAMPPIKHTKFLGYKTEYYYTGKGKNRVRKKRRVPRYSVYTTPNTTRYGTETYIWAADRTDEKEEFVGEQVGDSAEYVPDINDPEFKARALLWTKKHFDKSLLLATLVEEEFGKTGRMSLGVKQRNWKGIWVLQATGMPSILVETGFLTNREEEDYLNSAKGQEETADDVFQAIKRYKETIEAKQNQNTSSKVSSTQNKPAKAVMPAVKRK